MLHRTGQKENWTDLSLLGQEPTFNYIYSYFYTFTCKSVFFGIITSKWCKLYSRFDGYDGGM